MLQCLETWNDTHQHFFLSSQLKSCTGPTTRIMLSPVTRWRYWLSTQHKQIWQPNTQKEVRIGGYWGHVGENRKTIKIGTVVSNIPSRDHHVYSKPNEDTRRASRDDAMVNKKGGETKFHLAHSETAEVVFTRMLGSEKSSKTEFQLHRKKLRKMRLCPVVLRREWLQERKEECIVHSSPVAWACQQTAGYCITGWWACPHSYCASTISSLRSFWNATAQENISM